MVECPLANTHPHTARAIPKGEERPHASCLKTTLGRHR